MFIRTSNSISKCRFWVGCYMFVTCSTVEINLQNLNHVYDGAKFQP